MIIIGLTGSIGMGKSTVADMFRDRGIAVFDADAEVHQLYAGDAVDYVEKAFPGTTRDGVVDRQALIAALAGKPENFARLEAIVHPLVRHKEQTFLHDAADRGASVVVLEIPLLFETGLNKHVDIAIVVSASAADQRERVLSRPNMSEEKFGTIISQQMPDEEKRALADFVVDSSTSLDETRAQIDMILGKIKNHPGGALAEHWG